MTNLQRACSQIEKWCSNNDVPYSLICVESNLQGIMLSSKNQPTINNLFKDIDKVIKAGKLHVESTRVRSGTVLTISTASVSETQIESILNSIGEEAEPLDFTSRICDAFHHTVANTELSDNSLNEGAFLATAVRIAEGQFKSATQGITRANQTSLQRQRLGSNRTLGGAQNPPAVPSVPSRNNRMKSGGPVHDTDDTQATTGASQAGKGPPTRFEDKQLTSQLVAEFECVRERKRFNRQLTETLAGMATPSGAQPGDLFTKFAQALSVLGQSIGTGPLQTQLKQQGINWKKSDDGQSIILFVMNAQTNAPQPIARISAETLEQPSDFESQLLNIMDFAKGEAPGSFKLKQDEMQAQEKAVREIAKQVGPQDPIANQMQPSAGAAQQAVAPKSTIAPQQPQPQPQQPQQQAPQVPNRPAGGQSMPQKSPQLITPTE